MEEEGATQPLTQPYFDPRRLGRNNSDVSDDDASDVICILHPNSPAAHDAVLANVRATPQHILQNDDLHGLSDDYVLRPEFGPGSSSRDIALRFSSNLKNPSRGFIFGRNPKVSDILLVADANNKAVSNTHFRIFINEQATLMLQDVSSNGTVIDDTWLRNKKDGRLGKDTATQMLSNGSLISLATTTAGKKNAEVKFLVRTPKRGDFEAAYHTKLVKYVAAHTKTQVSVTPASSYTYGMHWHGGPTYNVVGMLGKGAFATVYRLATKREGQIYAAKELDKRRFMKNGILDLKFDNEINIMKGLRHPNIVQYIDYVDYDQWVYIIMEFVPRGELSTYLRDKGPVTEQQGQLIAKQVLHALDYLHRRNITHRDIKPDNILVAQWDPLIVKLSDFGLSKCINDEETFLKTFCGTLLYCAPEIYPEYGTYQRGMTKRRRLGEPAPRTTPYDHNVDMWSFGAVLFHILCGRAPILGRGDDKGAQMLANIMTKDVDFDPLRTVHISENAIDFISKLLNKHPLSRPSEEDCFNHPWIRSVPDHVTYEPKEDPMTVTRPLDDLREDAAEEDFLDDDDEGAYEAMLGLPGIAHDKPLPTVPISIDSVPRVKRRRVSVERHAQSDATNIVGDRSAGAVQYPTLPNVGQDKLAAMLARGGGGLFNEYTPSVLRGSGGLSPNLSDNTPSELRSSGVFGPNIPDDTNAPAIRNRMEQIAVNDFAGHDRSGAGLHHPQATILPRLPESAPSLGGAEARLRYLNMASPESAGSDVGSPVTENPATPTSRDVTPPANVTAAEANLHDSQLSPKFTRHIDMDLLDNEEAFAASVRAREASRARHKQRASTFQINANAASRASAPALARTMQAPLQGTLRMKNPIEKSLTSKTLSSDALHNKALPPTEPASPYASTTYGPEGFVKPPPRLGKLTPLPSSFVNTTISLGQRMTSWGRLPSNDVVFPDANDVRIPKEALQVTFWAPGVEEREAQGQTWRGMPGIITIISTKASAGISVNNVKLMKVSRDGGARLYGKIYHGDIVTVHDDRRGVFLKFLVEIGYGDSARTRPEKEAGFEVQRETQHHGNRLKKQQSLRTSTKENIESVAAQ